jgi:hypothetical protein
MKQHTKPCGDCAFRRTSKQGNLGGSPVETYVGQVRGPFWIPCHSCPGYRAKQSVFGEEAECAGTGIMRANLGLDKLMPKGLRRFEADHNLVFSTFAEFMHHHDPERFPTTEHADDYLTTYTPEYWLSKELGDQQAKILNNKEDHGVH